MIATKMLSHVTNQLTYENVVWWILRKVTKLDDYIYCQYIWSQRRILISHRPERESYCKMMHSNYILLQRRVVQNLGVHYKPNFYWYVQRVGHPIEVCLDFINLIPDFARVLKSCGMLRLNRKRLWLLQWKSMKIKVKKLYRSVHTC